MPIAPKILIFRHHCKTIFRNGSISFLPELFEKEQAGGGVGHVLALEPEAAADADVEADVALRG